jgi:hypothetical protein
MPNFIKMDADQIITLYELPFYLNFTFNITKASSGKSFKKC